MIGTFLEHFGFYQRFSNRFSRRFLFPFHLDLLTARSARMIRSNLPTERHSISMSANQQPSPTPPPSTLMNVAAASAFCVGDKRKQVPDIESAPHQSASRLPAAIVVANEIEIFNSDRKRLGAVIIRADMTVAEFWRQVTIQFNVEESKHKFVPCVNSLLIC